MIEGVAHKIFSFPPSQIFHLVPDKFLLNKCLNAADIRSKSTEIMFQRLAIGMEWQVLPLLLLISLPFSQPGAVQFDPSTIDSTIANYEFVFLNFYADW